METKKHKKDHSAVFVYFWPFLPSFLNCTQFLTLAVFLLWWYLSLLFSLIPSLSLSVSVVGFSADRTLIDRVDATQFCTVQCTAILLQWTPVSWFMHKTPLCSEWNVPTEGGGPIEIDLLCGLAHTIFPAAWGGWRGREMYWCEAVYFKLKSHKMDLYCKKWLWNIDSEKHFRVFFLSDVAESSEC